jgi:hypothetical protein
VNELAWEDGWLPPTDLMVTTGDAAPAAQGSSLACYGVGGVAARVYYLDGNGHVNQLWWDGEGGWSSVGRDLTAITGVAPAAPGSSLACYGVGGTDARVYYLDGNGHVYELAWEQDGWVPTDLMVKTGAASAVPGSSLACYGVGGDQARVYYIGADDDGTNPSVFELAWEGGWVPPNDLGALTGAPTPALTSSLTCYGVDEIEARVYYWDINGNVNELAWDGGWGFRTLTS